MKKIIFITSLFFVLVLGIWFYSSSSKNNAKPTASISLDTKASETSHRDDQVTAPFQPIKESDETSPMVSHESKQIIKTIRMDKSATSTASNMRPLVQNSEAPISESEVEQMEQFFDEIEQNWMLGMKELLVNDLGMDEQTFNEYNRIKQGYERDKFEAFESYHNTMLQKYGEDYPLQMSEQEKFENNAKSDCHEQVKRLMGEDNYQKYQNYLKSFNQKSEDNQDPSLGVMFMDC